MSNVADARKRELDAKREKLRALQARTKTTAPPPPETPEPAASRGAGASGGPSPQVGRAQDNGEIDKILLGVDVLIGNTPAASTTTTSTSTSAPTTSTTPTTPDIGSKHIKSDERKEATKSLRKVKLTLQLQNNTIHDIPPREIVKYDKGTQFPDALNASAAPEEEANPRATPTKHRSKYNLNLKTKEEETETPDSTVQGGAGAEGAAGGTESEGNNTEASTEPELPELDEETRERIVASEPFKEFIDRSTRIVDRALYLAESLDIMQDYKAVDERQDQEVTHEATLKSTLFDDRWSKHRSVTDLAWSHKHSELVLSSYSANEGGSHDPDGVVLVWNANTFFQKPEFVFNCQSSVMTAQFSKFHSTLIAGGTYSGQIVLWDTRARAMPVLRTPLSAVGHTHPVYSIAMVGSTNAHNLVTVSTDGKMCVWSMDNLAAPTETLELSYKSHKPVTAAPPVAATTVAFQEGEVNCFFVGSEEGAIFQAYRHGTTSGITERYDGHFGPVTSTDFHPARGSIDFSHLFLSASTDWTVKLWSSKFGTKPIVSFEDTTDYVYDARWSPTHPAVFATADGTGHLDIWNMNEDNEAPIIKVRAAQRALNRAAWSADGHRIMVGDAAGYMYLYDVGEVGVPDNNEWNRFEEVLAQLGSKASSLQVVRDEDGIPLSVDEFPSTPLSLPSSGSSNAIDSTA